MNRRSKSRGFTLVELSIVLVIIGLLVGGVLVGQDLINAAGVRSVISDIDKYNTAVHAFRDKYSFLPGDFLNTEAARFKYNTASTDAARDGTANHGDGNGLIMGCNDTANSNQGLGCETILFWTDLSQAGLIAFSGKYTSITATAMSGTITNAELGNGIFPKTKLRDSILIAAYSNKGINYLAIGAMEVPPAALGSITINASGALTPLESRSIDIKLDDGEPQTGILRTRFKGLDEYNPDQNEECVAAGPSGGWVYSTVTDAKANTNGCGLSITAPF